MKGIGTVLLWKRFSSLTYLNLAQVLLVLVDSIFRLIVVYSLIDRLGDDQTNTILAVSAVLFVLPFLVFTVPAGQLADRVSKKRLIVWTLLAEVVFITIGYFAIGSKNMYGTYSALFLVALQTSIFSPAKYSILPEIVPEERISRANGYLTLYTYLSIIAGTFLASFITEITHRDYASVTLLCWVFACLALFFGSQIEKTPVQNPNAKISPLVLIEIYRSLKIASKVPHLLLALFSTAYFLFSAAFTQLNLIPFGVQSLGITDVQTGYVYLAAALGIGVGSFIVGTLSGKRVELGLSIWGAFGTATSYVLLGLCEGHLFFACLLFFSVGMHGGLFVVPLDAYIQVASPKKDRGFIVSTSTFLSFGSVLISAGFLALLGNVLELKALYGYVIVGVMSYYVATNMFFKMPQYMTRLFALIAGRIFYRYTSNEVPEKGILVCRQHGLEKLFALVNLFQRITFIVPRSTAPSGWTIFFYRLFNKLPLHIENKQLARQSQKELERVKRQGAIACYLPIDKKGGALSEQDEINLHALQNALGEELIPTEIVRTNGNSNAHSFFHFLHVLHGQVNVEFQQPK
ncbi:MAG: Lysophospholipid transporter LplT [Chlamydiia bacterium]|nr:Lysophospholipid transporter LplT [Chlamydiia bacterium]